MRKIAFAVCLIGLLIGSTLGGLALADKGGDPDYGSSPLGEIEEISDKIGNITDMLDNPEWGLEEIKREIASMEQNSSDILEAIGNVTDRLDNSEWGLAEIKTEVESIENDLAEIIDMMPCTPDVLDVSIEIILVSLVSTDTYKYQAMGTLETVSSYPVYNIYLDLLVAGNKLQTIHLDALMPSETYNFNLSGVGNYGMNIVNRIAVTAKGRTPWSECLTAYDFLQSD